MPASEQTNLRAAADTGPRIRDVARHAGVSPATVSRVLNGSTRVRPDSVARVVDAVRALGYRPNRLARNLRRQTAEMIGVVVSDIENPHFSEMVRALEDAAFRRGFRVLLCNTDEDASKQAAYLEVLAGERVEGVVLTPSDPSGAEIGQLLELGIPVVAFDRRVADPRADSVVSDGFEAGRRATEHLLSAGHTRVGLVGGRPGVETATVRRAGYESAMTAAGLERLHAAGDFRIADAARATDHLLDAAPPPTALVVANNLMAIGVLRTLARRGVAVPGDVALVALDDPFWAALVEPPLTVLGQPVREMADAAMRLLLDRIGGDGEVRHEVFPFTLRVRGSCGTAGATSAGASREAGR